MNKFQLDALTAMIGGVRQLQIGWTDIYVWNYDFYEIPPTESTGKQYQVTIRTEDETEAMLLLLLLNKVADLRLRLESNSYNVICT